MTTNALALLFLFKVTYSLIQNTSSKHVSKRSMFYNYGQFIQATCHTNQYQSVIIDMKSKVLVLPLRYIHLANNTQSLHYLTTEVCECVKLLPPCFGNSILIVQISIKPRLHF